jgi:hypothetical protein
LSRIRTHDPSVRVSEDSSCLRSRGQCYRFSQAQKQILPHVPSLRLPRHRLRNSASQHSGSDVPSTLKVNDFEFSPHGMCILFESASAIKYDCVCEHQQTNRCGAFSCKSKISRQGRTRHFPHTEQDHRRLLTSVCPVADMPASKQLGAEALCRLVISCDERQLMLSSAFDLSAYIRHNNDKHISQKF